jgi:transposase
MTVIIGVDPHKATRTAVAIDSSEGELGRARVRATGKQVPQLLAWAKPLGADLGYRVRRRARLPAGPTARRRRRDGAGCTGHVGVPGAGTGTGRSDNNDRNDALSVAIAALRTPGLHPVRGADHSEVLRLLAKRTIDIGNHRTRVVCRLHNMLMELAPGGIAKELNASDAVALLAAIEPANPVEQTRHALAAELLAEMQQVDAQLQESHRRIRIAVKASATTLTDLFGVGPVIACYLIGCPSAATAA